MTSFNLTYTAIHWALSFFVWQTSCQFVPAMYVVITKQESERGSTPKRRIPRCILMPGVNWHTWSDPLVIGSPKLILMPSANRLNIYRRRTSPACEKDERWVWGIRYQGIKCASVSDRMSHILPWHNSVRTSLLSQSLQQRHTESVPARQRKHPSDCSASSMLTE